MSDQPRKVFLIAQEVYCNSRTKPERKGIVLAHLPIPGSAFAPDCESGWTNVLGFLENDRGEGNAVLYLLEDCGYEVFRSAPLHVTGPGFKYWADTLCVKSDSDLRAGSSIERCAEAKLQLAPWIEVPTCLE